MSKQIVLMVYNKTLLCDTKEQTADTWNKAETGMVNFKCITLSERSQTQKMSYWMIPLA